MAGGGKSGGGSAVVGYKYFMGVQLVVCHGPVDSLNRIIIGEREAWAGSVGGNATISLNKPELFGGQNREGGVVGEVDVMMGGSTQSRNTYLTQFQGAKSPAYRGLMSLVFKRFMWSSGNPYFKAPWIDVTRILSGWSTGSPWHPELAVINGKDMNAAHIIYQCLTDPSWGMGYNVADLDDTSFLGSATTLFNESFGLSLKWDQQSTIEDFVKVILTHINGTLGIDLATGKFVLRLIRGNYDPDTLDVLDESNIIEFKSFQRAAFGDAANEVVVTYTDRDENEKTIAVQDLASISAQGGVISTTKPYPGIRDDDLAARVAQRDLATLASPLAQATIITTRATWNREIGDVVKVFWDTHGLNGVIFRIISISKGSLTDSKIEVKLVEDVFGLPDSSYTATPPTQWIDNVVPPIAPDATQVIESPYWEIVKNVSLANQAQLQADYGFGMFLAGRGAVQSALSYVLSASADNVTYDDVATGHFNPTGLLASTISRTQTTLSLSGAYDLDNAVLSADGGYAVIGDELVSVISVDPSTGAVEVGRGILDTIPVQHTMGTRMYFVAPGNTYDPTERVDGETVYYKPRPSTGLGTLDITDADYELLTFANRASRPYPPGNFKIDGQRFPVSIAGPGVTVTWAHRDRLAQTVSFADHTVGNIGPEPGTTYRLRVYSGTTLKRTYEIDGSVTTWSYPTADSLADGNLTAIRITLCSVRDNLESEQLLDHAFSRSAVSGGTVVETAPATPTLTATPGNFNVNLTWVFGDLRTNIDKVELRVADVPEIAKGTTLKYVEYPGQEWLDETGTARTYKWYWARVLDNNGLISPWSNMVSGRALIPDAESTLTEINGLLTEGSGSAKIELIADRFSIKAPDGDKVPFAVVEKTPGNWKTLLNSDVLIGGNVDIANLNSGSLPNNVVLSLGNGIIELDGAGEIRVRKSTSPTADFVRLSSGEIRFLRYIAGAYQTYNFLSRLETGVANNGTEVTIPGYWKAQPRVMVSPAALGVFKVAYANQDQSLICGYTGLQETTPGSGVWKFTPTATLSLAASSGGGGINNSSGAITSDSYTSAVQTTAANCVSITPSVSLTSQRGNGASQYLYRTVRWRVEYWNGSTWVPGSWRNVNMGAQFAAVNDSATFTFPSAGTWQWRIGYQAFDTDGTVFGAASYTYGSYTVDAIGAGTGWMSGYDKWMLEYSYFDHTAKSVTIGLNSNSAPAGSQIYQVDYKFKVSIVPMQSSSSDSANGTVTDPLNSHNYNFPTNFGGVQANYTETKTVSQSSAPTSMGTFSITGSYGGNGGAWLQLVRSDVYAIVYHRTPVANSTVASNTYVLSSYTYSLTSAQVLSAGSLNWIAVGE